MEVADEDPLYYYYYYSSLGLIDYLFLVFSLLLFHSTVYLHPPLQHTQEKYRTMHREA